MRVHRYSGGPAAEDRDFVWAGCGVHSIPEPVTVSSGKIFVELVTIGESLSNGEHRTIRVQYGPPGQCS